MVEFDAIIIGAGPNGLTLANYVIKAGGKVLIVEKRHDIGGSLLTEDFGGSRFNLHALYMPVGEAMPPYANLSLDEYGCLFVKPGAQATLHSDDGPVLTLYRKAEKSAESIAKVSKRDAAKFTEMAKQLDAATEEAYLPWTYNAPLPPDKQRAWMEGRKSGKLLSKLRPMSPLGVLDHFGIDSGELRLALLVLGCVPGADPKKEDLGLAFISYLQGFLRGTIVRGGSYLLASSLYKQAVMGGAEVMTGVDVEEVETAKGRATGIRLNDGRRFRARAVISTSDVQTTFQKLLHPSAVSQDMASAAIKWQWDPWSLFQAHWSVSAGRPVIKSLEKSAVESMVHVVGFKDEKSFLRSVSDVYDGRTVKAGLLSFPTLLDRSQAPKGMTVAKFTTMAPYRLKKGSWDDEKETLGSKLFELWSGLTDNVSQKDIRWKYFYPPTYIEMKLSNAFRGSINGGANTPEQNGYCRPSVDTSSYRTPIGGFYICGASVHPGGGVTLAGGYNAASAVVKDLGLRRWWKARYPM